ncbi:MAG: histidine kinase [bacterium]|nr:histidine kinase [bacterium]
MRQNLNGKLSQLIEELARNGLTLSQVSREFEKQFILATLRNHKGNLSRSAQHLGIHRNTLRNKVGSLGIEASDYLAPSRRRPGRQSRTRKSQ